MAGVQEMVGLVRVFRCFEADLGTDDVQISQISFVGRNERKLVEVAGPSRPAARAKQGLALSANVATISHHVQ